MFINFIILNISIFLIGLIGLFIIRKNLIIIIISLEILLLSINLNFILISLFIDDLLGQLFSLIILVIAAAETAIGLSLIILFFKIRTEINIFLLNNLKA